jgi:hypothetical protein
MHIMRRIARWIERDRRAGTPWCTVLLWAWGLTQMVPNPHGVSTWFWEIRANGTYAFWSTGPGAVAPHSGTLLAAEGKWAMNSPSWVDGGTYHVPNANTLVANGRLGTGYWHRQP